MSIPITVLLLLAKGACTSHGAQLGHDRTLLSELGSELFILPLHPAIHIIPAVSLGHLASLKCN